jgi:hypothetical protein
VGTLQIYKDAGDPGSGLFEVGLMGNGVRPGIVVDTNTVDFGSIAVDGAVKTLGVLIANTNTVPCMITCTNITGSTDFTIDPIVPRSQFILGPNTIVEIPVVYDPSVMGTGTARLVINSNSPSSPSQVPLQGIGLQGRLQVNPFAIGFGAVTLGVTNTLPVTLSNTGNTNVVIKSLKILAGGAFQISGASAPLTILPGTNVIVGVNYVPVSATTILILDGTMKTKGNSTTVGAP